MKATTRSFWCFLFAAIVVVIFSVCKGFNSNSHTNNGAVSATLANSLLSNEGKPIGSLRRRTSDPRANATLKIDTRTKAVTTSDIEGTHLKMISKIDSVPGRDSQTY
jgi:hypothetical protein